MPNALNRKRSMVGKTRKLCTGSNNMRPTIHNKNAARGFMRLLQLASAIFLTLLFCATFLPAQTAAPEFKLVVTGDVPTPLSLSAADLASMPRDSVEMPDPDGGKTTYEGVPLQEILKKAGIPFGRQMHGKDLAGYVLASAKDDYQVVFSLGELD